jgi:hypothetical protein
MAVAGIAAEREIHARCSSCLVIPIEWRDATASEQEMTYDKTRKLTADAPNSSERVHFRGSGELQLFNYLQTEYKMRRHTSCISKAPETGCRVGRLHYVGIERLKKCSVWRRGSGGV